MPDIIFARPRDNYDSYSDLWRLITLSGFPLIYIDEIDADSDNVYIFSTPSTHWHTGVERVGWPGARARIIYWNIEWYDDVSYHNIPGVEVWSADKWHADKIGAKYVPMGSHPDLPLEPLQDCPKVYDVALLAYYTNRRLEAINWLQGGNISIAPRGWGAERHSVLQQTAIMLHVHQNDGVYTVAPQRWALAAAYKMPLVTEHVAEVGIFSQSYMMQSDRQHLTTFVRMWRGDHRLTDYGHALHQLLCVEHTFRRCVEAAL